MSFKIYKKRCDQCLFSDNKIVSDKRKAEILADCTRSDTYFICHKSSLADDGDVMCRGHYDETVEQGRPPQNLRIAQRLRCVVFVDLPEKP